jgi:magnesium-transporting ATPase (P-type)
VTEEKREKVRFEGVEEEAEVLKEKRFDLKIEFPFSTELKRMTMIYVDKEIGQAVVLIKGAVRGCVRHPVSMLTI